MQLPACIAGSMLALIERLKQTMAPKHDDGLESAEHPAALLCEGVLRRLAHDLKSPLLTLVAYCHAIRQDCGDAVPESTKFMLDAIVKTATKMDHRIKAVTQLAEALVGVPEKRVINLCNEVNLISANFVQEVGNERISIHTEIHPAITVEFASGDLQYIVEELLRNASKFSDKHPVHVHVYAQVVCSWVSLKFADDGIGVARRHGERLFELFYRNNRDEEYDGDGAGLTIARALAIRNNCTLTYVDGQETLGATFELLIPYREGTTTA